MNEKIKQLAEQAGIDITDLENCPVELYGAEQQLTKFAELIVRECLDNCMAANDQDRIREHFGVEE
jgi:hypothetical protein